MNEIQSSLKFRDYTVNKVEFYNNNDFEFGSEGVDIDFDISSNVEFLDDEKGTFLLNLILNLFSEKKPKKRPFLMNLDVTGVFELDAVNDDEKYSFSEKSAVAILFPYLRALVSNYTANANVPPLILPPINVIKYIENKKIK